MRLITTLTKIIITIRLNKVPEAIKAQPKTMTNAHPNEVNFTFILGVIACKWHINHNKKRIRIFLPESKRYLAKALKLNFGGTISTVSRPKSHGIMWQATSTKSFKQIREVARKTNNWLPPEFNKQLLDFLNIYL